MLREQIFHNTPEFIHLSEMIAEINSSLKFIYPQIKSSLRFLSFIYGSTVPPLLDTLNNSHHLVSFETRLDTTHNYSLLFEKFETLNHLSFLKLSIGAYHRNLSRIHESWKNFGDHLIKIKSLKELQLCLQNTKEPKIFIEKLGLLSQLQHLALSLNFSTMDGETFNLLAESVASLSHLESLRMTFVPPHINPFTLGYQISDLFKPLVSFKSLQVLHIFMPNFGQYLENNTLFAICDAIEKLTDLKEFRFDGQRSQIDDKGVLGLAKTLLKLVNLENIKINLWFKVKKKNEALIALLRGLSDLKHLERIDLTFNCSEVNLTTYDTVVLILNQFKNLSYFKLDLTLAKYAPNIEEKFEALLEQQYQYKKLFNFHCE